MTDLDLTKLREIAEAATKGPWEVGVTTFGDPNDGPTHSCVREAGSEWFDHVAASEGCDEADLNMAHIAAFDPPTVLLLIDEIERLQRWNYSNLSSESYGSDSIMRRAPITIVYLPKVGGDDD